MPEITAILPFFSTEENVSSENHVIEGLLKLSGQVFVHMEKGPSLPLEIRKLQQVSEQRGLKRRLAHTPKHYPRQFLRLCIPAPKPTPALAEPYANFPEHIVERIVRSSYTYALAQRIGDVVLAVNIANPGLFYFDPYFIYVNNRFHRQERGFPWVFAEAVSYAKQLQWPPIREIAVDVVWKWLVSLPGFDSGMVKGRIGRAISALTYLIPSDMSQTSPSDLVWALLGLEALYCNGTQGLKSQLMDKSAIVLGPRITNAKKFSAMYDYRSRFLHGDIDFPRAHFEIENDDVATFVGEAYDCWSIAVSMLLSTIQFLIINNLTALEFDYTVKRAEI